MTSVAITGAAGHVGRQLIRAFDAHPDIHRVVALDLVAPHGVTSSKVTFRQLDVSDPTVVEVLRGIDVVIHLAGRYPAPHDVDDAHRTNVGGACNVATAARVAGVRHLVYVSSVFAYGAHPDNDLPLTEASPLRASPAVPVGAHQREVEEWLAAPAADDGGPTLTILRFAMVLGPGIENVLTRLLESPRLTTVRGHRPPLQFLHLDDAVRAIVHTVEQRLDGIYNVSAEGWLSFDEVTAVARKRTIDVPEEVAYSTADRLWRLGIGEHPPGIVDHLMHPWVMSPDTFIATGWQPQATNRDALAAAVSDHAGYVALGGVRARRRTLGRAALAAAGLLAAVVTLVIRRRRRRHYLDEPPVARADED